MSFPLILLCSRAKYINTNLQVKSPTKILPAPQVNSTVKLPQRLILKPSTGSQIIQVPQPIASGQLHQINIPGKGMHYIKFVTATTADTGSSHVNAATISKTVPIQVMATSTTTNATLKQANIVLSEIKVVI